MKQGRGSIKAFGALTPIAAILITTVPAVADQTIATVGAPSPVSAFGGRLAWSAFDPVQKNYRLMTQAGGAVTVVPVAPRIVPFDVDLGPGENGDTVAAYSRCRRDPPRRNPAIGNAIAQLPDWPRGRGCDLFRFDFATGRESKIKAASSARASEFLPSVWKRGIAFARVYERRKGRAGDRAYLYVRRAGAPSPSRVPAGSRSKQKFCSGGKPRRCRLLPEPGPTALDLAGARLAFGWDSGGVIGPTSAVYLETIGTNSAHRTLISRVDSGDIQGSEIVSPQVVDGQVTWVQTLFGDETSNVSRRYRIGSGKISEATIPRPPTDPWFRPVLASAVTGQTVIQLASGLTPVGEPCTVQNPCVADPGCSVQQPCELRTAENLTYSPVKQ